MSEDRRDPDRLNPDNDPFGPPAIPTLVFCLHCREEFDSYQIEWREETDAGGQPHGYWCCPIPGCDGKGFGFDIFPVDPEYRDEDGELMWCDDEDDEFEFEDDDDEEEWASMDPWEADVPEWLEDDQLPYRRSPIDDDDDDEALPF